MLKHLLVLLFLLSSNIIMAEKRYDFRQIELKNGMKVISLEDFSCPIVAVQVWYHVGAKDENPQRQGFAHMFEHMMFRGTDRLNSTAHFDYIRRVGGNTNAYTAFDQTVYIQEVPSNQLEMVLWLEAERMAFLKIDTQGFYTELKVVEEEIRQIHNNPYGFVPEKLLAGIYGDKPYGWTPGGQIPHLRRSTIDELQKFWDIYYVPNNATLVVVGAVKHEQVQKLAQKYFTWIPRGAKIIRPTVPPIKQKKARTIRISENKGPLPIVGLLYRTVPETHSDYLALEMLMMVLGGGESSRLYVDIVKKQKIAQVALGAALGLEKDGLAGAVGVLLPFGNKSKLLKVMESHIEKVKVEGITPKELDKARNLLRRQEVTGSLTVASKASLLGKYATLSGDVNLINQRLAKIEQITNKDIRRVADLYLTDKHKIKLFIEPSVMGMIKNFFSSNKSKPIEIPKDNRIAKRTGPKSLAKRPKEFPTNPPQASPLKTFPQNAYTTTKLANGLDIVTVSNHEVPMVTMILGIKSGAWSEGKPGVASMTMQMLTKGTKSHNALELAQIMESNAIQISGEATMDTSTLSASTMLPQLEQTVELVAEMAQNPTFPKDELSLFQRQLKMVLLVSSKSPDYLADRQFRQQLYGDHPYSRTVRGELKDINIIKRGDLEKWWQMHLRPENTILYFAGDITSEQAQKLATKYFSKWQVKTALPEIKLAKIPEPKATHIYLVDRPGSVQSQIRIGHTSIVRNHSQYIVSRILSNILGGGFNSRLNKAIRVEKGLTYGASGGISPARYMGQLYIRTFTKNATTADTVQGVLDELNKLQTAPILLEELQDSQTYITGAFAGNRETPEATIGDLWMIATQNLPQDYLQKYLKGIAETQIEDVAQAAKTLIDTKHLTIVVVGEAKAIKAQLEKIAPVTVIK